MGMNLGNGNKKILSDINVTPLVDVMLVLLIIFMVTAPMMTRGVSIKLPETSAKEMARLDKHIEVTITKNGRLFIDAMAIDEKALTAQLLRLKRNGMLSQVLLRADKDVPYGKVVKIMAMIKDAGIEDLGLVTVPEHLSMTTVQSTEKTR